MKNRLDRVRKPLVAGFQIDPRNTSWKISAWPSSAGKRPGTPQGIGLPNEPLQAAPPLVHLTIADRVLPSCQPPPSSSSCQRRLPPPFQPAGPSSCVVRGGTSDRRPPPPRARLLWSSSSQPAGRSGPRSWTGAAGPCRMRDCGLWATPTLAVDD